MQLIDGQANRSYGATCGDLTVGNEKSFVDDIRDLFPIVRSGIAEKHRAGVMPFVTPALFVDFKHAEEVIAVIDSTYGKNNTWLIIGMHGVGAGTHSCYMEIEEHRLLIKWIASQKAWLASLTVHETPQQLQTTGK